MLAQPADGAAAILDQIPFVGGEDDGAAFACDQIGDGQILLFERRRRVDHHDDAIGEADGVQRAGDRHLFQHMTGGARAAAQTSRVVKQNGAAVRLPGCGDRIARQSCFRPRQRTFGAEDKVEQARFADIGSADDGQPQRPLGALVFRCLGNRLVGERLQRLD